MSKLHHLLRKTLFLYIFKQFLIFRIIVVKVFFDQGTDSCMQLVRVVLSFLEGALRLFSLFLVLFVSLLQDTRECSIAMGTRKVSWFSAITAKFFFLSPFIFLRRKAIDVYWFSHTLVSIRRVPIETFQLLLIIAFLLE